MYDVTAEDIRAIALGITIPPGEDVDAKLDALIGEAEVILNGDVPGLPRRVEGDDTLKALVQSTIKAMVLRVAKNPRALRSIGLDDLNATIDNTASSGELYLTAAEAARLAERPDGGRVGSIRLGLPVERLPRDR